MSRIGKKPVAMPSGVSANVEGAWLYHYTFPSLS
jgi:ribosomal protein L6P/L9E